VRHDHQRAAVALQRHGQRPAHLQVEVVGRLVQQQQVWPALDQRGEREARFLAARERPDRPLGALARKAEAAEEVAQPLLALAAVQARHHPQRRLLGTQQLDLVLGEVADGDIARRDTLAGERRELAGERSHERRLAVAVGADHRHAIGAREGEFHAREDRAPGVAGVEPVQRHNALGLALGLLELEAVGVGGHHRRDAHHALQALQAALRLARLGGLGAKALDEGADAADLAVLARRGGELLLELERARLLVARIAAVVEPQPAAALGARQDGERAVADPIEEVAVVRHDDQRAGVGAQPPLQPQDGVEVEVVGRLVEQQQVRGHDERAREIEAHAEAAGKFAHGARFVARRKAQPGEQDLGARARRVAAGARVALVRVRDGVAVASCLGGGDVALGGA
jgi:hypothetical protein